jgi:hypothetical protein
VLPSESVGATVTVVPFTVTRRKWKTRVRELGLGALPQELPLDPQPMP